MQDVGTSSKNLGRSLKFPPLRVAAWGMWARCVIRGCVGAEVQRKGHLASGKKRKRNRLRPEKDNGNWRREPPSNTWVRAPEQSVDVVAADYELTDRDRHDVEAGRALFFSGKALAKAELICRRQGGLEILWYWTAAVSNPWVIDDLILPDDQYATSGTCYAAPEQVLAVSRRARRVGRLIQGAGHSHGRLPVFSSGTDLDLMSQLAAERVGFASQVERAITGEVGKPTAVTPALETPDPHRPLDTFEVTFDEDPETWVRVTVPAGLEPGGVDVELNRLQRRQISFFTTHNAQGEHYFPVHHVTSCHQCGTRLEDHSAETARIRVLGPKALTEEEENDLIAELHEKAPRGGIFREHWGWGRSKAATPVELDAPDDAAEQPDEDDTDNTPAGFSVYRYGQRLGSVPAAVLEEAAYRCPSLARALGWRSDEPQEENLQEELGNAAAEDPLDQGNGNTEAAPDGEAGKPVTEERAAANPADEADDRSADDPGGKGDQA